jgi:hypothetical protein
MRKLFAILLIFLISVPLVFAGGLSEDMVYTTKVVYQGIPVIKNLIDAKSKSPEIILKEETDKIMSTQKYPYSIISGTTEIKVIKYKCDTKNGICGYWIEVTRDRKEIYTDSPIWISPPPYEVVVSEYFDEKTNELTVTVKEDPKLAVEMILQMYVDNQPLGKAVSYER